jgi:hypothetical protein
MAGACVQRCGRRPECLRQTGGEGFLRPAGVRKIFFHAGTCGAINGPDAGGVLFEHGGAPRKMYAGMSALTHLLGVPDALLKRIHGQGLEACVFGVKNRAVAVAWCPEDQSHALTLSPDVRAYDVMGNQLPGSEIWCLDNRHMSAMVFLAYENTHRGEPGPLASPAGFSCAAGRCEHCLSG